MIFLGTDPEFVILDEAKQPVPAWKFFPDKEHKLVPMTGYALFRDGFAMELNVPPSDCRESLDYYVRMGLHEARKRLPANYRLATLPTVPVDLDVILRDAPDDAMMFGCDPSWNARTETFQSVMLDATEHPFRYAGGHLHIAWGKSVVDHWGSDWGWVKDRKSVLRYVQLLDRYLGYPLSVWFNKPETFQRRKYYGQAGDFRFQDYGGQWYGIEYRTPGPEVWNNPVVASFAMGVMRRVAKQFAKLQLQPFDAGLDRDLAYAINNGTDGTNMLSQCYIGVDGSMSSEAQFLRVVGQQRPYQQLAVTAYSKHGWNYVG